MRVKDRRMIGLRLKPELYKNVERQAGEKKLSLNKFLNEFLEKKLTKKKTATISR